MKNHHEVGHFKTRLMILLLSLVSMTVMAGESLAATTCSTCHGMPPIDSADGNRLPATGAFKGSHQAHLSGPAVAGDCVACHSAATGYDNSHSATSKNVIGMTAGIYSKGDSFSQSSAPVMGTCSNVSCHADIYSAGTVTSPTWGSTGSGCAACHSAKPIGTNGPDTGSHSLTAHNVACTTCHASGTSSTTKPTTGHIDGNIDVVNVGYPVDIAKHTAGSGYSTCSAASCHADVYSGGMVTTPQWGTTGNGCNACHSITIASTGPATGSHAVHGTTDCSQCHATATNSTTKPTSNHVNGTVDVANGYPVTAKHAAGTYAANAKCSTASCHANVYGSGTVTTPQWGSTGNGCIACHSVAIDSTGPATGSHAVHNTTDCSKCHDTASSNMIKPSANHADGKIDVNSGYPATAKHAAGTYAANAKCSTATCHADVYGSGYVTTPQWGTTGNGCASCHTISIAATGPATGSHAIHNTTDCSKCHDSATNNVTKPTANHGDGDIDVNSGYPVTAKHAAGTYAANAKCSTASCHANVYGSGSVTTPQWGSTGNGCAACHTVAIGTNGPATGSHNSHAGVACTVCHAAGTTSTTAPSAGNGHIDGNVDVYYFNYPANVAKHAAGSNYGSCSTAYCHSNGRGSYAGPTWGGTSTGCNFCHPTLGGKHDVHTNLATAVYGNTGDGSSAGSYNFGCGNCHPTVISSHMNGVIDITLNKTHGGVLKSKNNVSDDSTGYTQNTGVQVTCAAAYCHSNGMATPTFYGADVNWYEASFTGDKCARCHGNSPNTGGKVGSTAHAIHTVGIHYDDIYNGVSRKLPQGGGQTVNAAHGRNNRSTTINCNICHAATVTSSANDKNSACTGCHDNAVAPFKGEAAIADKSKHVNGTVDISFINQKIATKAQVAKTAFNGYTSAATGWSRNNGSYKQYTSSYDVTKGTLSVVASYSQANGCLNVACHSGITVKWTDSITCTSCHTRLK